MRNFISFDIGGTKVKHGVITEAGDILSCSEYDPSHDREIFIGQWRDTVRTYRRQHAISAIGVSFPGYVNTVTGHVQKAGSLEMFDDSPMRRIFSACTDLPIVIENDANCAILGERWLGAGKQHQSLVCLTVGTGIGGGIIIDGHLLRGAHYRAGEYGYMIAGGDNQNLHDLASMTALINTYRRHREIDPQTRIDGRHIFAAAKHDPAVADIIKQWARYLAQGIYGVVSAFDPEAVLIGGGVCRQPMLYPLLEEHLAGYFAWPSIQVPVIPCRLGNTAGLLGAVYLARNSA